jgi:hypothetical protein
MIQRVVCALPVFALVALAACDNATTPSTPAAAASSSSTTSVASPAPAAPTNGANHLIIDGTPAPLSGKSTITSWAKGAITANFGIAPATIPQKYLFSVNVKLLNYPDVDGPLDMSNVASAVGKLAIDSTTPSFTADWTKESTDIAFSMSAHDRKLTLSWKGAVKSASGVSHDVDAVMTEVAVPFK